MSNDRSKGLINLGIVGGVILLAIFIAYLFGKEYVDLVFTVLKAIGLTLLGITLLVTIHELGHFLAAKAFGIRVEIFSIGFPPKLIGFKSGDTEYQLSLTPLGGYVKISGMIDESMDTDYLEEEPKDYEFRSKPVWQRFIVMVAGVVMNVLLGIFIFSMIYLANGCSPFHWIGSRENLQETIDLFSMKYRLGLYADAIRLYQVLYDYGSKYCYCRYRKKDG